MASASRAEGVGVPLKHSSGSLAADSDSSSMSDSEKPARLKIRTMKQELLYCVDLPSSDPRSALIAIQRVLGIPPVAQFLVYKGQYLSNSKTLGDYGLPAAPRPVKLRYLRRRNKRGVQTPRVSRRNRPQDEEGAIAGAPSLQPTAIDSGVPPLRDMDELQSQETSDSEERPASATHASTGAAGSIDDSSDDSGEEGGGLFAPAEQEGGSDSDASDGSDSDLFQDSTSQVTAVTPLRSIPLLLQGQGGARTAGARGGPKWVNEWQPEQVCEEQGDSHRSTVVYFTASPMVAQQLASHFTWKVEGSYTSAVVAQAHTRAVTRHKETIRQVKLQRKLQQMAK